MIQTPSRRTLGCLLVALAGIALTLSSCGEAFDGPTIAAFGISPSSVSSSGECGMSDEFFQAEAVVSGAESPIEDGQLTLLGTPQGERLANASVQTPESHNFSIINYTLGPDEDALVFTGIQKSWCQNLSPREYDIEVTAFTERGSEISRTFFGALDVNQ